MSAADTAGTLLGLGACMVCKAHGARLVLMKTGRVCQTCNTCKVQVFARGDKSDELIRDAVLPMAAPAPEPAPGPAPAPDPASPPKRAGWGVAAW